MREREGGKEIKANHKIHRRDVNVTVIMLSLYRKLHQRDLLCRVVDNRHLIIKPTDQLLTRGSKLEHTASASLMIVLTFRLI